MKQNDGGPAFPTVRNHEVLDERVPYPGMTLRDWFAGQALTGMFASEGAGPSEMSWGDLPDMAQHAYRTADAMLAERRKTPDA